MQLLKAAKYYLKHGISVIATGTDKRAILPWKAYQQRKLTDEEMQRQFTDSRCFGIAIICGGISGKLEVIDVDLKYDLTGTLFQDLMAAIYEAGPELSGRLKVVQTKSGGYHIYYRCEVIEGNQKLAQRPATDEEIKANPNEKVLVLIETRGEGGYVIAPPTTGYTKVTHNEIPNITPEEREMLLEICRSFNQLVVEQPKPSYARPMGEKFAVTPWEDYNNRGVDDMLNRLQSHGWSIVKQNSDKIIFKRPGKTESKTSGDYSYKHNLFTVFTTSSEFEPLKGYKPAAVFTVLECRKDFKEAAKRLSDLGYGQKSERFDNKLEREVFERKLNGEKRESIIAYVKEKTGKTEKQAEEDVAQMEMQWGEHICAFWDVWLDNENKKKIVINKTRFIRFLHEVGGFGLYFYDTASTIYRVVRVKDGFVEETSTEQMKKFIQTYVEGLPDTFDKGTTPESLMELIIKQYAALFNEGFLEFLPKVELDFLKDEKNTAYFPFKNGVVIVDRSGVSLTTYKEINKVIWKNQVKQFSISVDQSFAPETCEFYRFIGKISGEEEDRLAYCITLIGYLLHRYKDPAKPYAVVLAEETENDKDGGGTGKGIFVKAVGELLRAVKVDGKNFKIDKNFSLQRVSLDTQLIAIEDCDRNLDFEKFNSQITEGSTVEKKNKDELFIDYKDSPKFIFSTNYTINLKGNHGKRRSKVFEFAPFFGPSNTPIDFFGHLLFEDWDQDEWNRFFNLMFFCLSIYLETGIKEVVNSDKLKRKQMKLMFGEEWVDWFTEYSGNGCDKWKLFSTLYTDFTNTYEFDKKDYPQKRFKKALDASTEIIGKKLEKRLNRQQNNKPEYRIIDL